ncbi:MAG TPA: potassium-transporting ATPase subunit KdpC [Candidatus Binataceae bacterium]|nr:potassium-transporting ATPase subunit KdpC [Candidatus Binataceae bacterium]
MRAFWISVRMTIVLTILLGLVYPLVMVVIAHVLFPHEANGTLITRDGTVVGAEVIGQNFSSSKYFHSRPSAAGNGYDASNSGGSNLGPTNKTLIDTVQKRLKDTIEAEGGVPASKVPVDMVTASGSGLDPDISPASADLQIDRVARTRGLSPDSVRQLVEQNTTGRWAGILGEPAVNVLDLNLALDAMSAAPKAAAEAHSPAQTARAAQ